MSKEQPEYYPADDAPPRKKSMPARPAKLRKSLQPGTVVILVNGSHQGSRVVLLKHLGKGDLVVSGPQVINGVPLLRVNHRFVIATSTRIDISGVTIPEHINAKYFNKEKRGPKERTSDSFFEEEAKKEVPESRLADQKTVDDALTPLIAAVPSLDGYLKSKFSLGKGQYPHELRF